MPQLATTCLIDDCGRTVFSRGYCRRHYDKLWKYGDPQAGRSQGQSLAELQRLLTYAGDECQMWPFAKSQDGYGTIWFEGKKQHVSRVVCERVHGPAPTDKHEAAHSCGKGHLGCATPGHLSWKTRQENAQDCVIHGTSLKGERNNNAALTESDVLRIKRLLKEFRPSQIVDQFPVGLATICKIKDGKIWGWLHA